MASIKVKFRPSTASGREGSIYYQVIHGRIVRQVKTDYRIFDTEWDKRTSAVKILPEIGENRKRYLREVAEHIDWDTRRLKAIVAQCDRQGGIYSADSIIEKFNRQTGEQSLFRFMQGIIGQLKQLGKVRTSETYTAALTSFMKFREGQDILLCEIDGNTMMLYEAWAQRQGHLPQHCFLLYAHTPCRLQPCRGKGADGTEAPFQARLHWHREDGKTRHPVESHQTYQGT